MKLLLATLLFAISYAQTGSNPECTDEYIIEGAEISPPLHDVFQDQYCEIWVGYPRSEYKYRGDPVFRPNGGELVYEVYKDGDPEARKWSDSAGCSEIGVSVTRETVLAEFPGSVDVFLNGPRFRNFNATVDNGVLSLDSPQHTFSGVLTMSIIAYANSHPDIFEHMVIQRSCGLFFEEGLRVHEVIDPNGKIWIMQSRAAYIAEYGLEIADWNNLPYIEDTMGLPKGWEYRVRDLTGDLTLPTRQHEDGYQYLQLVHDAYSNMYMERIDCEIAKGESEKFGAEQSEKTSKTSGLFIAFLLALVAISIIVPGLYIWRRYVSNRGKYGFEFKNADIDMEL